MIRSRFPGSRKRSEFWYNQTKRYMLPAVERLPEVMSLIRNAMKGYRAR